MNHLLKAAHAYIWEATTVGSKLTDAFNTNIKSEFKTIFGGIIVPIATAIVFICLATSLITVGVSHARGYGGEEALPWKKWILLFSGIVVGTTISLWGWQIIGW